MKRGLFLCGSGLLGAGAIVGLPMMLAPGVGGPGASDTPVSWAEPTAATPGVGGPAVSDTRVPWVEPTAAMKRGALLSGNAVRSTGNHEPAAVSTEPTVTAGHTVAVAHASEMVSDPSTQTSEPPTPEPAAAAQNLVAAPRLEDLVVEVPQVPTLLVASKPNGIPKSPEEHPQPSPLPQPTSATGDSVKAFAGGEAPLISPQPESKPVEVAAEAEQLSRGSEEVSSPRSPGLYAGVKIASPFSEDLVSPRSEPHKQWPKPRIFIHHSSHDRDLALRLATKLNNAGFRIAELRTKNDGPSVASIRYYFDEDRAAAIASRESVRSSLSPAAPVRLQDFRHYEPKPSRGTVEVWAPWHEQRAQSRARGEMRGASMASSVAN
jgi:hypothetical protein